MPRTGDVNDSARLDRAQPPAREFSGNLGGRLIGALDSLGAAPPYAGAAMGPRLRRLPAVSAAT